MKGTPAVLLIQLGTPDAPTTEAVRRYLRQFLSDRRIIEAPRLIWWFILNFRILPSRPAQSAEKYRRVWDEKTGSPLLSITKKQAELLQQALPQVPVRFAMQIGNPPVADVVRELVRSGADRLIVLPMYPQYSATTTGSAADWLFKALMKERRVPALRIVPPFYDHPAYLDAATTILREALAPLPQPPQHHVLSFHGIPEKYAQRGDPYPSHVERSSQLLAERLGWPQGSWTQSYQSIFGRDPWLQPYTDDVLRNLAKGGVKHVFVATPGFTADCLETIDEIGYESRGIFRHAGGVELHRAPCLNDHPAWIECMKKLVQEEGQGWL